MARPGKGILGGFSGKVGTVVGGSWKGIPYMRSLPNRKKNGKLTPGQEQQQEKFKLASRFIRELSQLVSHSFQAVAGQTSRNAALSSVITQAIGGVYPNLVIDYSVVQVAKGILKKASNTAAVSTVAGKLAFSWTD